MTMTSRFPMPRYPNGWFQVAYSSELEPGSVRPLKYFGKDLVLFRTEGGEAKLLDAHCPHLGAHLGHGGKVKGDCIECPFHAWKFDGGGACVEIPYGKKIPPRAQLGPWPLREVNGMIMTWHHAGGEAPQWEVPSLPEFGHPDWTPYETRAWKIRTHNQEMAENSVDSAHFLYLHGTQEMPTTQAEALGHVLHSTSQTVMGTKQGKVKGEIDVHVHGFGFTTTRFRGLVETLLVSSATTIDEDVVELRFAFTVKKMVNEGVTSTVGAAFQREIARQLEQDIPIWENKIYIHPPVLVDGDGPIGLFRRWSKQFYIGNPGYTAPADVA
jgi:phenylpropionate dioxygenase-like ring-hydroxylating dioxygenase large terminal subunit